MATPSREKRNRDLGTRTRGLRGGGGREGAWRGADGARRGPGLIDKRRAKCCAGTMLSGRAEVGDAGGACCGVASGGSSCHAALALQLRGPAVSCAWFPGFMRPATHSADSQPDAAYARELRRRVRCWGSCAQSGLSGCGQRATDDEGTPRRKCCMTAPCNKMQLHAVLSVGRASQKRDGNAHGLCSGETRTGARACSPS